MKRHFGYQLALKVSDALRAKREAIESNKMTLPQITKLVSDDLGHHVPESTVRTVGKAIGIVFTRVKAPTQPTSGKWLVVAKAVAELYDRLGEKRPNDLEHLIAVPQNGHASPPF
jgi:hypothetical protein